MVDNATVRKHEAFIRKKKKDTKLGNSATVMWHKSAILEVSVSTDASLIGKQREIIFMNDLNVRTAQT